ncbi:uncharacterized protein LOC109596160 [Aethina tumida]|uniref:uncharacterized protein LOC109596160 n=1 Tax=Aethina tumida TaxID=116153 RepID=UPI00096B4C60|nr:uncharacterized protein LOC109596160 [Aethina tumida]
MKYLIAGLFLTLVVAVFALPSDYSGASGGKSEHTGHLGENSGVFMGNQGHSQQGGEVHGTLSNVGNKGVKVNGDDLPELGGEQEPEEEPEQEPLEIIEDPDVHPEIDSDEA